MLHSTPKMKAAVSSPSKNCTSIVSWPRPADRLRGHLELLLRDPARHDTVLPMVLDELERMARLVGRPGRPGRRRAAGLPASRGPGARRSEDRPPRLGVGPWPWPPPTLRAAHQIGRRLDQQLQLATGIGRGQHLEPVQPEQRSRHRPDSVRVHLGPSDPCDLFAVITDREGPRPVSAKLDSACRPLTSKLHDGEPHKAEIAIPHLAE
jgi:hypothetical protein